MSRPAIGTVTGTDAGEALVGSSKSEILIAGLGDDTVTGGKGADVFVFDVHRSTKTDAINIPIDGSVSSIGETLNGGGTYFAQTFTAIGANPDSLTIYLNGGSSEPFNFQVMITDPVSPTQTPHGNVLYTSAPASVPSLNTNTPVTFDVSELSLQAGHVYSWIIDTVATRDGVVDYGAAAYYGGSYDGSFYPEGDFFFTGNETTDGQWFKRTTFDLAFDLTFEVPASDGSDVITDFAVKQDVLRLEDTSPEQVLVRDTVLGTSIVTANDGSILLNGVHVLASGSEVLASEAHFGWLAFA